VIHDQASYTRESEAVREPLLSEKGETTVDVAAESPLPDELTREAVTLPSPPSRRSHATTPGSRR
jgi:hypothetical protein